MEVASSDVYNKMITPVMWKIDFACLYARVWGGDRKGAGHKGQNPSNEEYAILSKRKNKGLTWAVAAEIEGKGWIHKTLRRWNKRRLGDIYGHSD